MSSFTRPKLLDLYCCEGGGSQGYWLAGWDVYGIDLFTYVNDKGKREGYSQSRYPFPSHQGDVLSVMLDLLAGKAVPFIKDGVVEWLTLKDFDAISASPPCQHASAGTRAQDRSKYPKLIEPTRELLIATGLPYVIENVKGAALHDPILLCGTMFGLTTVDHDGVHMEMWRHRLFESNIDLAPPGLCEHGKYADQVGGSYSGARRDKHEARHVRHGGYVPGIKAQQELLGIDWMTQKGMHQSLPPVYTQHIGQQLIEHIERMAA